MASSPRKPDVSNRILVLDPLPLKTLQTLRLQHVCSPARQRGRNFPLLMLDVYAIVQIPCQLRMLFQILNAVMFVLEKLELRESVEATTGGMFMPSHLEDIDSIDPAL